MRDVFDNAAPAPLSAQRWKARILLRPKYRALAQRLFPVAIGDQHPDRRGISHHRRRMRSRLARAAAWPRPGARTEGCCLRLERLLRPADGTAWEVSRRARAARCITPTTSTQMRIHTNSHVRLAYLVRQRWNALAAIGSMDRHIAMACRHRSYGRFGSSSSSSDVPS